LEVFDFMNIITKGLSHHGTVLTESVLNYGKIMSYVEQCRACTTMSNFAEKNVWALKMLSVLVML
jgi:hypothetical protein